MMPADKKKRQAILAGGLFAVVIGLAIWDFSGPSASPSQPVRPRLDVSATQHSSARRGPSSALPSSFHLQFDRLARAERMDYSGDGHNLFGGPPVAIEAPAAPPRPASPVAPPVVTAVAKAEPTIDVKYAGFAESGSGNMNGLFMRGDDISVARSGDIIFHRFRVGSIQSGNAQLTDLVSNHSQRVIAAGAR
ncbi:MAG TPA: hypothetical protein VGL22_12355 [Terracidiphilus sp.]|jgi:hypothetical protein